MGGGLCLSNTAAAAAAGTHASSTVRSLTPSSAASAATAAASSSFKTFTSTSAKASTSRVKAATSTASDSSSGTTIYVNGNNSAPCSTASDTGTGTSASPYCSIQDAVNAAVSGDTVSVATMDGYFYAGFTVSNSGLTIDGNGAIVDVTSGTGLVVDGVTGVKISGFTIGAPGNSVVQVINSQNTTLDGIDAAATADARTGAISIDGASSGITVSRSIVSQESWYQQGVGISVASGASDVDLASDVTAAFGAAGIEASGDYDFDWGDGSSLNSRPPLPCIPTAIPARTRSPSR